MGENTIKGKKIKDGSRKSCHLFKVGTIGKGLNDYDAIFSRLKKVGFNGWISIEDGIEGVEQWNAASPFCKIK